MGRKRSAVELIEPDTSSFSITYYTQATAPHLPVLEAQGKYHPGDCKTCAAHEADHAAKECYGAPCAACSWSTADVRRVRSRKMAAVRAYLTRGTLPPMAPAWKPKPLFPKGLDAVVIAPNGLHYRPDETALKMVERLAKSWKIDTLEPGVAHRYLTALREKFSAKTGVWSCGCKNPGIGEPYLPIEPCERHLAALKGRDEEGGEGA